MYGEKFSQSMHDVLWYLLVLGTSVIYLDHPVSNCEFYLQTFFPFFFSSHGYVILSSSVRYLGCVLCFVIG